MSSSSPGFFGRLAASVMDRPRLWALVLLLTTALGAALGSRLTINANMLALLPEDDPTAEAIRRLNDEEGGTNLVTIAARSDDPAALDAFMSKVGADLEEMDAVEYALYDLDPDLAFRLGLLQLTPDELSALRARLSGAVAMGPAAANPFMAARLLDLGPLTEKLQAPESTALFPPEDGVARLLVRPRGTAHDQSFVRPFMAELYRRLDAADAADPAVEVFWVGGAYRHGTEDVENIRADLQWTAIVSLVAVLSLIAGAFRDPRAIGLIFVPLVVANVWTTGVAGLAVGSLNTFTSFFPAILIGLGVDFSIHLYSRYREERPRHDDVRGAVIAAWDKAGPPSATACLTSAGGFCALWGAGFAGFRQLGTILAGGVVLCLLAVLLTLPLLILWRERGREAGAHGRPKPAKLDGRGAYRLAPLGLGAMVGITLGASVLLPQVEFEFDVSEMRPAELSYDDLDPDQQAMAEKSYSPVVLSFDSPEAVATAHERLTQAVADGTVAHVSGVLSVHTALPVDQEERVAVLQDIAELARSPNVAYLPPPVQANLRRIREVAPEVLTPTDLPPSLRHVLGAEPGRNRILLTTTDNMWDVRQNVELFASVREWAPEAEAAGEYLALAVLYEMMQSDAPRVASLALLAVFLMTWLDTRRLGRALGAVAALASGMAWAGAALVLFNVKLSLVNFVGIPILMGIGVDVVIHLLHRIADEGPGRIRHALSTTGWASGLSTATTVCSFAALSVASAQGVQSLGLLIVIGLTLVSMVALILVPLGWMVVWRRRGLWPTVEGPPAGSD